jgi:hypothetical protein
MADLLTNLAAAAGAAGDAEIEPLGVDYDGSADYLSRATDLTGNSDGKTFTFSAWLYPTVQPSSGFFFDIADPVGGVPNPKRFYMRTASNDLFIVVATSPYETIVLSATISASLPNDTFSNVLVSCDMTNVANRYVYINDVAASVTWTTYANLNIPFTGGAGGVGFGIGATASGGANYKGRISGLYLDYTYRDLSIEANRRLFIDDDGLYVTPPTTGIISVPMDDPADPGRNDGTGGNFTLNGVVARSGRGPNEYNAATSTFDGANDYLSRASALSGVVDGKELVYSVWFKLDSDTAGIIYRTTSNIGGIIYLGSGNFRIENKTPVGGDALEFQSNTAPVVVNKWHHLACSFDMTNTNNRHVYLDNQSVSGTYNYYTDTNLDFTNTNQFVGQNGSGSSYFDGEIAVLFFDTNYIDLSTSNPFYDTETDKPKFLGATGELPTGSAPLIYLPLYASSAGTNLGTGGDFTVNSGPYVGARGPSEFWADSAEFNGSNQYLSRTSALSGVADGKVFSFACAFNADDVSVDRSIFMIDAGANLKFSIQVDGAGTLIIRGYNSGGTQILDIRKTSAVATGNWYRLLCSVDLTNASNRYTDLSGVSSFTYSTYTDDNIQFSATRVGVGANARATAIWFMDGKIGFLWFNTEYIDFSQEANRLKFFDAFNNPVDLGADGSIPTGNQPLIYMNEGFHLGTNLGSGGNFTPQNTPTDGGYVNG